MKRLAQALGPPVLLLALVLGAYSNAFGGPFVFDDATTIPGNPSLRHLWPLTDVLFPPAHVYSAGRPLLNLSFALNYAAGGLSVTGYHVVNLAIHFAAVLALYGLAHRLLALPTLGPTGTDRTRTLSALAIAAVWAVHPLLTGSVTYISQRAECLMGLFYLLVLYCFVRGATGSRRWLVLSVVACLLGMLTKEVMVTVPVLVFLVDWKCVTGSVRETCRRRWPYYAGLASTWLVLAALIRHSSLAARGVGLGLSTHPLDYARLECAAVVRYLRLTLWPDSLVFDYGPMVAAPAPTTLALCFALLASLFVLGLFGLRGKRYWGLPIVAFFILLAPTSSFVPVTGQPIAENRAYLPCAAVVLAVACAFRAVRLGRPARWIAGGCVAVLVPLTFARNRDYQSETAIWRDTYVKQPDNERAWVYHAVALMGARQDAAAAEVLAAGVARHPDSPELLNNYGAALYRSGKLPEAIVQIRKAIVANPRYSAGYQNLGAVQLAAGDPTGALATLEQYLPLEPDSPEGHYLAALCLARLDNFPAANAQLEHTLRLNPAHEGARTALAQIAAEAARRAALVPPPPR